MVSLLSRFFDRDGTPIDLMTWARLYDDWEYRHVALSVVGTTKVVTIWFGHDPELEWVPAPDKTPMIFGTAIAVTRNDNTEYDEVEVYRTLADAQAGHVRHVAAVEREQRQQRCPDPGPR